MMTVWAVLGGFVLDALFGDPAWLPHPVVYMGKAISKLEKFLRPRLPKTPQGELLGGAIVAFCLPVGTFLLTGLVCWGAARLHPLLGLAVQMFWCGQALAARGLVQESTNVYKELKKPDLPGARKAVSRIVGRDTAELTAEGVTKAAVETVAENASDGVIAPLLYMLIGGAPLALTYKAINTMDSMLGYKNEKYLYFGRVPAKLDDVASYAVTRSQSFNSANKFSQAYIAGAGRTFYKGAPEKFLAVAQKYLSLDGDEHPLDLESLNAKIDELAGKSMRVLAFGYSPSEMTENAINADTVLIGLVGIRDDQLDKSPFELSGGQKRRVAIAGVIAMEPRVLILDEPTAGLDPVGVESILGNIRDYHQAHNATIILVSHSMEEVARTVDRLVVVNDGRIPFHGAPSEVFQHGPELEAMGLGVPQMTRVFNRLRAMGVDIGPSVYTIEQAKAAVLAKLKGVG